MRTKDKVLTDKFKEANIKIGWVQEVKDVILDAMEEYAIEYANEHKTKIKPIAYIIHLPNEAGVLDVRPELKRTDGFYLPIIKMVNWYYVYANSWDMHGMQSPATVLHSYLKSEINLDDNEFHIPERTEYAAREVIKHYLKTNNITIKVIPLLNFTTKDELRHLTENILAITFGNKNPNYNREYNSYLAKLKWYKKPISYKQFVTLLQKT